MTEKPYECPNREKAEKGELNGPEYYKCFKCDSHGKYTVAGMERSCWEYVLEKMLSADTERDGEGELAEIRGKEVQKSR